TLRRWQKFQAVVDDCDAASISRDICLGKAQETWRSAKINCAALPNSEQRNCRGFAERWNKPVAEAPPSAVKHAEEPTLTSPSPGDPRPAERNRDSTKQQEDALGTAPQGTKSN